MLLERGIDVSYETIRRWVAKFRPRIARRLRRRQAQLGDIWHLDEVAVKIAGRRVWHWPAVVDLQNTQPRRQGEGMGGSG